MGHGPVRIDPAIERFNTMREESYLHFRWTRRTIRSAVLGFVVVPTALFFVAKEYNRRWNFEGTLKGQNLTVSQPSTSDKE